MNGDELHGQNESLHLRAAASQLNLLIHADVSQLSCLNIEFSPAVGIAISI